MSVSTSDPPSEEDNNDDGGAAAQPDLVSAADNVTPFISMVLDGIISSVVELVQAAAETIGSSGDSGGCGNLDAHQNKRVAAGAQMHPLLSAHTTPVSLCNLPRWDAAAMESVEGAIAGAEAGGATGPPLDEQVQQQVKQQVHQVEEQQVRMSAQSCMSRALCCAYAALLRMPLLGNHAAGIAGALSSCVCTYIRARIGARTGARRVRTQLTYVGCCLCRMLLLCSGQSSTVPVNIPMA